MGVHGVFGVHTVQRYCGKMVLGILGWCAVSVARCAGANFWCAEASLLEHREHREHPGTPYPKYPGTPLKAFDEKDFVGLEHQEHLQEAREKEEQSFSPLFLFL